MLKAGGLKERNQILNVVGTKSDVKSGRVQNWILNVMGPKIRC